MDLVVEPLPVHLCDRHGAQNKLARCGEWRWSPERGAASAARSPARLARRGHTVLATDVDAEACRGGRGDRRLLDAARRARPGGSTARRPGPPPSAGRSRCGSTTPACMRAGQCLGALGRRRAAHLRGGPARGDLGLAAPPSTPCARARRRPRTSSTSASLAALGAGARAGDVRGREARRARLHRLAPGRPARRAASRSRSTRSARTPPTPPLLREHDHEAGRRDQLVGAAAAQRRRGGRARRGAARLEEARARRARLARLGRAGRCRWRAARRCAPRRSSANRASRHRVAFRSR